MGLGVGFQHFPRAVFFDEQDFGVTAGFFAVDVLVEGNGNFGFALGGIGVGDFADLGGGDFTFFFHIETLYADREFIGNEWLAYLRQAGISYCIRCKENAQIAGKGAQGRR